MRRDDCDFCDRTVAIVTERGEQVRRGIQGIECSDGAVICYPRKTTSECFPREN